MYEICQNSKNETPLIFLKRRQHFLPNSLIMHLRRGDGVDFACQFATCVVPLFKVINLKCLCGVLGQIASIIMDVVESHVLRMYVCVIDLVCV
jgi:hypothetical protein